MEIESLPYLLRLNYSDQIHKRIVLLKTIPVDELHVRIFPALCLLPKTRNVQRI